MSKLVMMVVCLSVGASTALCQQGASSEELISKSATAIGYQVGGGSTQVDLKATDAIPQASGEAKVEAKTGVTTIEAKVQGPDSGIETGHRAADLRLMGRLARRSNQQRG